jgi:hypothetical protein
LHEGITLKIPVHRLVIHVVGPLLDLGPDLTRDQIGVRESEVLEANRHLPPFLLLDLNLQVGDLEELDVTPLDYGLPIPCSL